MLKSNSEKRQNTNIEGVKRTGVTDTTNEEMAFRKIHAQNNMDITSYLKHLTENYDYQCDLILRQFHFSELQQE